MRAFIVRPFNTQSGVDFEAVERLLIAPALQELGIDGRTTQEITAQGNIRADMFRMLVSADLVVADLSIHNANVFYELGIRHGLRNACTFLLRANLDKYPFDLSTDRYFVYDAGNPGASVERLVTALRNTIAARTIDSPVYEMLPALRPPDPASLQAAPREFREDVERARDAGHRGDLRLLAHEARGFEWEREGLRLVGRAQVKLQAFDGARETFEWLLKSNDGDIEAFQRLATIYQRLAGNDTLPQARRKELLTRSSQAVRRVLESPGASSRALAEGTALQARNIKSEWRDSWDDKPAPERALAALRSPLLRDAADLYARAYEEDLSHCYSGVNALSLYRLLTELVRQHPDVWDEGFESEDDARTALRTCDDLVTQLTGSVRVSLRACRRQLERQIPRDDDACMWLGMSDADFAFLTATRPGPVAQAYRKALAVASAADARSAREQLAIFALLGVRSDFASAALAVFDDVSRADADARNTPPGRVLLFTGHMIDEEGRKTPRFPRTPAAEQEAARLIAEAVSAEIAQTSGAIVGIAGGACGGDILFHEACFAHKIDTQPYLAVPPDQFSAKSVQRGGPAWVERFLRLTARTAPRVLGDSTALPPWLAGRADTYTVWNRSNLWMLYNALALNPQFVTLIALWDGSGGDGPGGTADLVQQATSRGHKVVILDAKRLKTL
ncbi:MAG: tetratricopeptide repeat-containing protein [Vicinamibacterales bacterium]